MLRVKKGGNTGEARPFVWINNGMGFLFCEERIKNI